MNAHRVYARVRGGLKVPPALQVPVIRWLIALEGLSALGSAIQSFGMTLWVYRTSGNRSEFLALGTIIALACGMLAAPLGGRLARCMVDRLSVAIAVCQCALALVTTASLVVATFWSLSLWGYYLLIGVSSALSGMCGPAEGSLIQLEAGKKLVENALYTWGFVGNLVGLIAASLIPLFPSVTSLLLWDAATYVPLVWYLLWKRPGSGEPVRGDGERTQDNGQQPSMRGYLKRYPVALVAAFSLVVAGPVSAGVLIRPLLAEQRYHSSWAYGVLTATNSVAALLASLLLVAVVKAGSIQRMVVMGVATGGSLVALGLMPWLATTICWQLIMSVSASVMNRTAGVLLVKPASESEENEGRKTLVVVANTISSWVWQVGSGGGMLLTAGLVLIMPAATVYVLTGTFLVVALVGISAWYWHRQYGQYGWRWSLWCFYGWYRHIWYRHGWYRWPWIPC